MYVYVYVLWPLKEQVTVRKSGEEVAEYDGVWPKGRKAGDLMEVCSVTVTPEAGPPKSSFSC